MKKFLSLLVITLVALSMAACAPTPSTPAQGSGSVIIGTPAFAGSFVNGFGNNATDVMMREMLWSHSTFVSDLEGIIIPDPTVVRNLTITVNEAGDKTYTFEINTNLKWSDGTAITAEDYVFAVLFAASPEWRATGASDTTGRSLVGYADYRAGTAPTFEGVKLLGSHSFSLTISNTELPFFFEETLVSVSPAPMHVWGLEDVSIAENGSQLVGDLAAAANHVATTQRFGPTVSSGPFKFVSNIDRRVTLEFNPHFVGDFRGNTPKLANVFVQEVNQDLNVDLVISGDIDIVTGIIQGDRISKIINNNVLRGDVNFNQYERNGFGHISFSADFGPTANKLYRQAVAHLLDRQLFISTIVQGWGLLVNGSIGLAQWMYQAKSEEINDTLINYVFNVERANDLLDQTEWVFEADGETPWDRTQAREGYWRHNAQGERLRHNHFGTTNNNITDLINTEWPRGMNQAGIEFFLEFGDFSALLSNFWVEDKENRFFHSYNLATGFGVVFDPFLNWHSEFYGDYQINPTGTNDPELDRITEAMRRLEPTQRDEYLDYWFQFQVRWNELLPQLPLYSNIIFDVFTSRVQNVNTSANWPIGRAIVDVSVAD